MSLALEVLHSADAVAQRAAEHIADVARDAITRRGRFVLAVSGGSTPEHMLRRLAELPVSWEHVYLFQVDERVAPRDDPARNLTQLSRAFVTRLPSALGGLFAMAVEEADLDTACESYSQSLREIAGEPPVLDLVHLGLGADGHTASLVPGDVSTLNAHTDIAVSIPYNGPRRLTMTAPLINRARQVMWVVTGDEKHSALERLRLSDASIPASLIRRDGVLVLADREAAGAFP